ncbi:MAG: 4Fe-4S binding protein [candidate division Zixibacteria bacterium]
MKITSKHLGRHAITIQYPEERWEMPEGSRGIVVLLSDKESGELNCTSCMLCMRACPTAAIQIVAPRGEDKKRHLNSFDIDFTLCCFCGLCEEACNFCAIKMAPMYEYSTVNKEDLVWDMKKLQEAGLDIDYVDTRKKKKPKPPAPPASDKPKATEQQLAAVQPPAAVRPQGAEPPPVASDNPEKPAENKPTEPEADERGETEA